MNYSYLDSKMAKNIFSIKEELKILGILKQLRELLKICWTNPKAKIRVQETTPEPFTKNKDLLNLPNTFQSSTRIDCKKIKPE